MAFIGLALKYMPFIDLNYEKRTYGLDLFRAVAITLVVFGHGLSISGDLFQYFPSIPMIDGVDLFFVLSGFLIGSILIRTIEENEQLNIKIIFGFLKRRWYRTLPNYYLFLLINFVLVNYHIIDGQIKNFNWKFLFFLQNFSTGFVDFFWESWSLSIEEWFYIFLPFIILLLSRFLPKQKAILWTIITMILAPLAYRIAVSNMVVDDFWFDVNFRKLVLTRLDTLIYGVLAAYIKFYHGSFFNAHRNKMFVLGVLIIYINIYIPKESNDFFSKTFSFSLTSLGAALLLAKADGIKDYKIGFIGRLVTQISVISYAMYLVNLALVSQVIAKNFPPENKLEHLLLYIAYWLVTICLSWAIYNYYEKPIMDLRDKRELK